MRKIFMFLAGVFVCALSRPTRCPVSGINSASPADQLASTVASPSVVGSSNLPALSMCPSAEKIADAKQL